MSRAVSKPATAYFATFNQARKKIGINEEFDIDLSVFTDERGKSGRIVFRDKEVKDKIKFFKTITEEVFDYTGKETLSEEIISYKSASSYYICYNDRSAIPTYCKYQLVSINTIPKKGEKIEVIGIDKDSPRLHDFFTEFIVPQRIYDYFSRYGLYILFYDRTYYLCVMR